MTSRKLETWRQQQQILFKQRGGEGRGEITRDTQTYHLERRWAEEGSSSNVDVLQ